jgi:hypothetical protein
LLDGEQAHPKGINQAEKGWPRALDAVARAIGAPGRGSNSNPVGARRIEAPPLSPFDQLTTQSFSLGPLYHPLVIVISSTHSIFSTCLGVPLCV